MLTPEQFMSYLTPAIGAVGLAWYKWDNHRREQRVIDRAEEIKARLEVAAGEVKAKLALTEYEVKARLAEQDRMAQAVAAEVKRKLEEDMAVQKLKLEEIHIDVNSRMTAQKKLTMEALVQLAAFTHDPEHAARARLAQQRYHEQIEAQQRSDERVRLFLESEKLKLIAEAAEAAKKFNNPS